MPQVAKYLVWHLLLPTMSTFGTVLAYCLPMYGTIRALSAGLLLHKWTRDALVYVLLCDLGWAEWALSIGLVLCSLPVDKCVCWLSPGRGSVVHLVPRAVLCVVIVVSTVLLTTNICSVVWWGWQFDKRRKNLSWSKLIIVVQICALVMKNACATKMIIFDKCEEWRNEGAVRVEECTREESATLLVLRSGRFVRRCGRRYTRHWALFENKCSISWDEMNMFWIDEYVLIPDVRCHTAYWSTVVMYCAHRKQKLGIGMYLKIYIAILNV
jgi:hypothetical protein